MKPVLRVLPLLLVAAACAGPTELVVFVDTDIPLAPRTPSVTVGDDELRFLSISLECITDDGDPACDIMGRGPLLERGFGQDYTQIAAGVAPPFYLGVLRDGDVNRRMRISIEGSVGPDIRERFVLAAAETSFVEGTSKVVVLVLRQACVDAVCPLGQTCSVGGACVNEERAAAELPEWTGECTDFSLPDGEGMARECVEVARFE